MRTLSPIDRHYYTAYKPAVNPTDALRNSRFIVMAYPYLVPSMDPRKFMLADGFVSSVIEFATTLDFPLDHLFNFPACYRSRQLTLREPITRPCNQLCIVNDRFNSLILHSSIGLSIEKNKKKYSATLAVFAAGLPIWQGQNPLRRGGWPSQS